MKKLFSVALTLLMLIGCISLTAFAEENKTLSADVYVTIADKGTLVVTQEKITVTDIDEDKTLTINDALFCAHKAKYDGGADAGYIVDAENPSGLKTLDYTTAKSDNTQSFSGTTITSQLKASDTQDSSQGQNNEVLTDSLQNNSGNYRLWVSIATVVIAGIICGLLYLLKKRNLKNFVVIIVAVASVVLIVLLTDFQTTENYYNNAKYAKENAIGTVTLTIRCDTITDKSAEHIPEDGVILEIAEFEIEDGDTVYDILLDATAENKINLETGGGADSVYVEGIGNIYELDFGDLSGWIYFVNGESSSVSCGQYTLADGDRIEWLYTCEMGEDLKN